jgi:large subunit ribosomal protein L15
MRLEDLRPAEGAVKNSKRVGRGPGSGTGGTAARGNKGQLSRSGSSMAAGFEGGQMPLQRRMPKRGFTNIFRVTHAIVNLCDVVDRFPAGSVVTPADLQSKGLIKSARRSVKLLGEGDPTGAYTIKAHAFSESARAKVEKAGGTCEVIER